MRFSYQDHLNKVSAENDNNQVVFDLRSNKAKGVNRIPKWTNGHNVNALEKKGIETNRGKQIKKIMAINSAKAGRERYIQTFAKVGSGNRKHAGLTEHARQEIAHTYFDIMYGDGSTLDIDKDNLNDYGR